jgi:2-oxoisovalerate dehydrogenase E2 component (dihydrolipoyl transacylase)
VGLVTAATQRVFTLPDLGEGLTEAEIVTWRVAVGDVIETDQIVVEVETAKAIVDVPCPYPGRVTQLHGVPGELRPVGQPLVTVTPVGAEPETGSGQVLVGYGTRPDHPARRRNHRRPGLTAPPNHAGAPSPANAPFPANAPSSAGATSVTSSVDGAVRVISPLVRRAAREAGIDVTTLRGSGPGGVIRRADVDAAIGVHNGLNGSGGTHGARSVDPHEIVIELRGVRGAIADKMTRSRQEIPDVTIWVDVDATGLLDARSTLKAAYPDRPVGLLALLARICVDGLERFPALNSRVDAARREIVRSSRIHLGVAASTDRGLVVPVITDAHRLNLLDLADQLAEVTASARAGTLPPARLTGGTFTLNNYGVFGVDGSTPIINHPEAALFGIGRIVAKPWVVNGGLAVRQVAQISLTFDHRVCDGVVAGGFLRYVADRIEQPTLLLAQR